MLAGCRALVLVFLVLLVCRPVVLLPPRAGDVVVPVLVDVSRSMRVPDADGQTRLARAIAIMQRQLLPVLSSQFVTELYSVGDGLTQARIDRLSADARGSDLSGALAAVQERHHGQAVAGIVLLSDGDDTSRHPDDASVAPGSPVFAVGIGAPDGLQDREVVAITAGDQRLDQASVDLRVSVLSTGFGRVPFQLRLSANGRELESRRVVPSADGRPIDEVFTVSPDAVAPTVYRAEISAQAGEPVTENNVQSVLVNPVGRRRRLLVVAGAPGFEHSFMLRAWSSDPALEVDSVVRKGRNADGQDTFVIQAAGDRAASLARGFPSRRDDLFAYDGLVIANVESEFFTRAQLGMAADFVSDRGGGLLVVGGRSLAEHGLTGTPLENVLPVELTDRRGSVSLPAGPVAERPNKVVVTSDGENHPAMRIGNTPEETRRLWAALPPLAGAAPLGGPRPGATVLAIASGATGGSYPVLAAQPYGRGRSLVFAGEASWRWKMMLPSTDRSYEFVWRQAARWTAGSSPDRITVIVPEAIQTGETTTLAVEVRDAMFAPVPDASMDAQLTGPDGEARVLKLRYSGGEGGRYTADEPLGREGLYRFVVEARRGTASLGKASRWVYVGGVDREFIDPRLNDAWLQRVARASGGRYVRPADASRIVEWLREATLEHATSRRRDLWHEPWAFALIVAVLSAEWILRRRWGLR